MTVKRLLFTVTVPLLFHEWDQNITSPRTLLSLMSPPAPHYQLSLSLRIEYLVVNMHEHRERGAPA
jgi:hypothetical protein